MQQYFKLTDYLKQNENPTLLRKAKTAQSNNSLKYGLLYSLNYRKKVREKNWVYYEMYGLPKTEEEPEGYKERSI